MVGLYGPTGLIRAVLVRFTLQGYIGSIRRQSLSDMSTLIPESHRSKIMEVNEMISIVVPNQLFFHTDWYRNANRRK